MHAEVAIENVELATEIKTVVLPDYEVPITEVPGIREGDRSALKNMLTCVPRGLGQLVQGKPRGAIGAFSDTIKGLAIAGWVVPGPWQDQGLPPPLRTL